MDIASMLEVEVQEVTESKENVTPSHISKLNFPCQTFSNEENDFYKLTYGSDVASIRFLRLHCTACDEHIGSAPAEAHNMHEHPVLRTLLCAKCREFYGDGTFEQGDDATDMFCRWCANGGNLYCCSYCSNTFCSKCIKRNFDSSTIKRIEAEDSWKCFVCDSKDLFPLRSVARALITHIETVTRILENDRRMSLKEVEEKMHLDETKCCSRKRKRRRRRTLSNSDDDEEEDSNYIPNVDLDDVPPVTKRKIRKEIVRNVYSNGYMDHEYFSNSSPPRKVETYLDPTDLMIPCEQTMIEGDTEIINPNNEYNSSVNSAPEVKNYSNPQIRHNLIRKKQSQHQQQQQKYQHKQQLQKLQLQQQQRQQLQQKQKEQIQLQQKQPSQHQQIQRIQPQQKQQVQQQHKSQVHQKQKLQSQEQQKQQHSQQEIQQQSQEQQKQQIQQQVQQHQQQQTHQHRAQILRKVISNNSVAINPVPLANLLKVALSTGAKRIKVTHGASQKLVAVPMSMVSKSLATSNLTFVKSTPDILVPKNVSKNLHHPLSQQCKTLPIQIPSIIDLDSDDEPIILENNNEVNNSNSFKCNNTNSDDEITANEDVFEQMQIDNNSINIDDEPISSTDSIITTELSRPKTVDTTDELTKIMMDEIIPLKIQQRNQRFKKMLLLQSQEIDNTLGELKTKILKVVQVSNTKSQQGQNLLHLAALCTKRFHRALRKTLVELSHINDRIVRDYVNWRKKTDKMIANIYLQKKSKEIEDKGKTEHNQKIVLRDQSSIKDDLSLEMICVRDSASESDNEENEKDNIENNSIEAMDMPAEFSQILDHLTIFKRKPTAVKAVGDDSVLMEDKACQAYDVHWKDYEKCIGHSLLTRLNYNLDNQKEVLQPTTLPDEHFGKYQEQYLFYLQHIEDFGIETDELKGLPDTNHIPLKDLIDGTSPFIMDMLERLSPATLSNGCTSPPLLSKDFPMSNNPNISSSVCSASLPTTRITNTSCSTIKNSIIDHHYFGSDATTSLMITEVQGTDTKISDENVIATSKAVEELVKMVTKLSEDLRSEQVIERKQNENVDLENETFSTVNSILNVASINSNLNQQIDDEIAVIYVAANNNDKCTVLK